MQFAILVNETSNDFQDRTDNTRSQAYWAAYTAYSQALRDAGILSGGHALEPNATAKTVRVRDGKREVQDGPFADTREMLGGLFVIDVSSMEEALEWAAKCPSALTGSAEVRPLMVMSAPAEA